MNIIQAAKLLNVRPQAIRNRIARGEYKARKIGPRHAFELNIDIEPSLTVRELAEKVKCSPRCIQYKIKRQIIKCRKYGNRYAISLSEAREFILRQSMS